VENQSRYPEKWKTRVSSCFSEIRNEHSGFNMWNKPQNNEQAACRPGKTKTYALMNSPNKQE
jgi:hypothetical protein